MTCGTPSPENNIRCHHALDELKRLILDRFPTATFDITHGDDPCGVYLVAMVDVEDIDDVIDAFLDRLVIMQIDEGLPIYVMVERTPQLAPVLG